MEIVRIANELLAGFDALRAAAAAEGFLHINRLWSEWQDGSNRFTQPGESLFAANDADGLAGVGGVTVDYALPNVLRMRRFYIHPRARRAGLGRRLAGTIIEATLPFGKPIVLHAPYRASAAFWEAVGFRPQPVYNHTHTLRSDWRPEPISPAS